MILNHTCLDVVENNRDWLESLDVEAVANQSFRTLKPDGLLALFSEADALILPVALEGRLLERDMENAQRLKTLSIAASGYDCLDVPAATRNGIIVTYAPIREGAEVVADMAWGLILSLARRIPHHDREVRAENYERGMGIAVWGKTLGIVGLGNIGKAVARRARGFDMRILAAEPKPDTAFVESNNIDLVSLEELLSQADFVSLHTRLTQQTKGMIGERELSLMKPEAYLINTARFRLVDEDALAEAVLSGGIAGAAVDDPPTQKDCPLLKLPNFISTPHLGNRAIEGANAVFRYAMENVVSVFRGERPCHVVNPEVFDRPNLRIQIANRSE